MPRVTRSIIVFAAGAASMAGWTALRPHMGTLRSLASQLRSRLTRGANTHDDWDDDGDTSVAPFEWVVQHDDSPAVTAALAERGVTFVTRPMANSMERPEILQTKLRAVGMHFDQEPGATYGELALARVSGAATAAQITNAVDMMLNATNSGLIVDTTMIPVEIDQQGDLGHGQVVLIEPTGATRLRAGTRRGLVQAIRNAAARGAPVAS